MRGVSSSLASSRAESAALRAKARAITQSELEDLKKKYNIIIVVYSHVTILTLSVL